MSAAELHSEIDLRARSFSRRAVFKELKALEALGVLLRNKGRYALQLIWIINMASLFRGAFLTYAREVSHSGSIPLSERVKLTYRDLARLDYTWMQFIVVLRQIYPKESIRVWKPEHWFHLVHEHIVESFFSALDEIEAKQYHLIGHDCFTCLYGAQQIPRRLVKVRFVDGPFGLGRNTYLTLIGDHLITIRLSATFSERMYLFRKIRDKREMMAPEVLSLMRGPVKATLTVEYRPKGIVELQERFDRVFNGE